MYAHARVSVYGIFLHPHHSSKNLNLLNMIAWKLREFLCVDNLSWRSETTDIWSQGMGLAEIRWVGRISLVQLWRTWGVISYTLWGDHRRQGQVDSHHNLGTWCSGKSHFFYQCFLHKSIFVKNNSSKFQMWNFYSQLKIQDQVSCSCQQMWHQTAWRAVKLMEPGWFHQLKIHPWEHSVTEPKTGADLSLFFSPGIKPTVNLQVVCWNNLVFLRELLFFASDPLKGLKGNLLAFTAVQVH